MKTRNAWGVYITKSHNAPIFFLRVPTQHPCFTPQGPVRNIRFALSIAICLKYLHCKKKKDKKEEKKLNVYLI